MIWVLISAAIMIAGVLLFSKGRKLLHDAKRYEFENRTGGGVVQFENYDASVQHTKKRGRAADAFNFGLIMMVAGGIWFTMALANVLLGG
ncbi:hypothetical protein [Brevundimonas sp.]|uniref:hypothetical protein n=1 Tax=Brevundimonas sp. TaxID=1871086 RepID=UPI003F7247C2